MSGLKLYIVERTDSVSREEYDSFICAATDEVDAKNTFPTDGWAWDKDGVAVFGDGYGWRTWCEKIDTVEVRYIGEAGDRIGRGVILASFNAG